MTVQDDVQNPDAMVFKYHKRIDISHVKVGDFMQGAYNGSSYTVVLIEETTLYNHIHMEIVL